MNRLKAEKKKLDALISKYGDLQHPAVQEQSQRVDKLIVAHMREMTA
jgi:hypothetical protein